MLEWQCRVLSLTVKAGGMKPLVLLSLSVVSLLPQPSFSKIFTRVKRNDFTNNYGYGVHGIGPSNIGVDSFGFYRDKFHNSGLPPLYTFSAYRNYYHEISFHKNKYFVPPENAFETLQQERYGPYYRGVWGYADHSPYWFGK